jgi:Protein of unknown function (DUF1592)/Protein of unknown function (DUF1588)/Protein of unknown function (DUF1587)/Protein of unknown function (DUF1585)/Protein of unknown function (DUF1595)/Ca-dependent carbohydrate-binding module xylan-binding
MIFRSFTALLPAVLLSLSTAAVSRGQGSIAGKTYAKDIQPLMEKYCWDCHGDGANKGDVVLDAEKDEAGIAKNRKLWMGAMFHIEQWTMPPHDKKTQPTKEERELLVAWLDNLLNPVDPKNPDPGRVTLRRLNRVEYNNTVRDLLGVNSRPADEFPEDDTGYGFDNIGDVLALPPILMERYLIAADRVLSQAIPAGPRKAEKMVFRGPDLHGVGLPAKEARMLAFNGETHTEYLAPADGEYILRVRAWGDQAGPDLPKLELRSGGKGVKQEDLKAAAADKVQTLEARVNFKKGAQRVGVAFLNDFYDEKIPDANRRDRNVYILNIEVDGPVKTAPLPLNHAAEKIFGAAGQAGESDAGARAILQQFTNRAFRRAALPAEVDRLMTIFKAAQKEGESWRDSLRITMKAVLVSPYFLYRMEWQEQANNPLKVVEVPEFALASRLSYWLWSSTPDDELLSLAFRNQLRAGLKDQVLRMLKDPKARALPENFGGQWLELRTLNVVAPDKERFPEFNSSLRSAMRRETEELFWHLLQQNRPVTEFLNADYTFLNEPLAKFYGVPGVQGDAFRMVKLDPSTNRRGIFTHASVLTVTSDSVRTSPVKRGKWLLENILGITAPPPPPNVPALEEGEKVEASGSVRQRLEAHRTKPGCAGCHSLIDPLGFALENYNAIGKWREKDGGHAIDASGMLTTGQKFGNAQDLAGIFLNERRDTFLRNVVKKMMTYALGRGIEPYDRPAVDAVLARMAKEGNTFQSMILAITESLPFQKRRGDGRSAK